MAEVPECAFARAASGAGIEQGDPAVHAEIACRIVEIQRMLATEADMLDLACLLARFHGLPLRVLPRLDLRLLPLRGRLRHELILRERLRDAGEIAHDQSAQPDREPREHHRAALAQTMTRVHAPRCFAMLGMTSRKHPHPISTSHYRLSIRYLRPAISAPEALGQTLGAMLLREGAAALMAGRR